MVETRPFISQESVKGALDHLLYSSSTPEPSPLTHLLVVDYFLSNPDFPRTSLDRDVAIKHILAEIIRDELFEQRTHLGRENPANLETLDEAAQYIREDAIDQNPELIGWSLLFYRYIRVELNISTELYGRIGFVEQRSLRRYQLHSTKRLTEKLIQREWEVRHFYRQMRLQIALPSITPLTLFGRDAVFEVMNTLFHEKALHHFQITGIAGIGKSVFIQEFVRMHIEAQLMDEIVWINRPKSVQFIRYQLIETLSADQTPFDLRQYSLLNRLYVILDDADLLDPIALQELLLDLSGACVIMTAQQPNLINSPVHHVGLSELTDKAAIEMIRSLADAQHDITDNYAAYIWQSLGGNPLVIKLAISHLSLRHPDFLDVSSLDHVFDKTFALMPDSLRTAWIICVLYPPGDIDISQIVALWPDFIQYSTIDTLLKRKLLEEGHNATSCRMVWSARHYLENSAKHRDVIDTVINRALDYLSGKDSFAENHAYELMEHILLSEWPVLDSSREDAWMKSLAKIGISRGRNFAWLQIFERYANTLNDTELCFHYATVLRHLSIWEKSQQLLETVIATYGQQGGFVEQGRALLELGCLFRQKGAYADALRVFARVEKVAAQYQDARLENDVRLEIAQVTIDQGDLIIFDTIASRLPRTIRLLSMQITACLIAGDLDRGLEIAKNIISQYQPNAAHAGRIYGTMGRICEQKHDYDRAAQYFGQAITILEQERDRYALARVQSNLAAILTHLKLYDEAYQLLETAKEVQQALGDRAGLAATQHNLNILHQIASIH